MNELPGKHLSSHSESSGPSYYYYLSFRLTLEIQAEARLDRSPYSCLCLMAFLSSWAWVPPFLTHGAGRKSQRAISTRTPATSTLLISRGYYEAFALPQLTEL